MPRTLSDVMCPSPRVVRSVCWGPEVRSFPFRVRDPYSSFYSSIPYRRLPSISVVWGGVRGSSQEVRRLGEEVQSNPKGVSVPTPGVHAQEYLSPPEPTGVLGTVVGLKGVTTGG